MNCEPYRKTDQNKYNPNYITKLLRNYRSHPIIIHVSNKLFYDNELLACGDENIRIAEDWIHLAQPKFPIIFHGVEGTEIKTAKSPR
jgi:helicase MOV-10